MSSTTSRIIVALDVESGAEALRLARLLKDQVAMVKVGLQVFTACGPPLLRDLSAAGLDVFLDLKLHDIPNTVAGAAVEAFRLGVSMMTLHTLGGEAMLREARERVSRAADQEGLPAPRLLGVTVLTSLDQRALEQTGIAGTPEEGVARLASLAFRAGLDGVVCSPRELPILNNAPLDGLLAVTPGVRPRESGMDDQKRVMTPGQAIRAGADYLVIGRPITRSPDPLATVRSINLEISRATLSVE